MQQIAMFIMCIKAIMLCSFGISTEASAPAVLSLLQYSIHYRLCLLQEAQVCIFAIISNPNEPYNKRTQCMAA